jgi:adenine-specific DNA-methyltransferase
VAFSDVVCPGDPERFIHLVTSHEDKRVRNVVAEFLTSLSDLGLTVSTGRVVDFRARDFLRQNPSDDTVPLIYPSHFNGGFIHWPKNGRKPNAIVSGPDTADLLVPAGIYVLVKRFTTKEETRRIVACIYDPDRISAPLVGFENHLNYFHARGGGLDMRLAKGLAAFLNSGMVDNYFRQFNGHTQVNATDLRSLKYPTRAQLLALGAALDRAPADGKGIDVILEKELNARA